MRKDRARERYDPVVRNAVPNLLLDTTRLKPGIRVAVGVSGGADSVALLRALEARRAELGVVLSVAHLHHGLRGAEADADLEFVREIAERLGLPFLTTKVDVAAESARLPGKPAETTEEAARRVRYAWFRELMTGERCGSVDFAATKARRTAPDDGSLLKVDAVATAHTLDDQAETVLAKLLRGAWTEGISGIHPMVEFPEGRVVRPLLGTTRAEVEAYLKALGQEWREDSSNRHLTFTRNRIRLELLPMLEGWNPRLREHLAQMAELARDEEIWWEGELERVAPRVILAGKPVRGGGRTAAEDVALDLGRLAALHPAVQRRLIRAAALRLGAAPDFRATEELRRLAASGRAGQKRELAGGLLGVRMHRELRLSIQAVAPENAVKEVAEVEIPVPGEGEGFGVRVRIEMVPTGIGSPPPSAVEHERGEVRNHQDTAVLRAWKAGDRVHLRHSSGPRKVKEVLERMKVAGEARARWPVVELGGRIVWMQGVQVEGEPGIRISVAPLESTWQRSRSE